MLFTALSAEDVCTYIHLHLCVWVGVCICVYVCVCVLHAFTCFSVCVCAFTRFICVCVCVCVCAACSHVYKLFILQAEKVKLRCLDLHFVFQFSETDISEIKYYHPDHMLYLDRVMC